MSPPAAQPVQGMPPPPSGKERGKVDADGGAPPPPPPEVGGDGIGIGALPDDALHHILSFLPAEDAVRTCVLARRWRHLWKSATGLRIGYVDGLEWPYEEEIRDFVDDLLCRRLHCSIRACDIRFRFVSCDGEDDTSYESLNTWTRHVVALGVRVLRLQVVGDYLPYLNLDGLGLPLVSQHLTTLELAGISLYQSFSNFSNCPNLQHLKFGNSVFLGVDEILSKSLKHLSIGGDCFFDYHTRINTPSLVSLRLDAHFRSIPVLGSMPSLKEAFVSNTFVEHWPDEDCISCGCWGILPVGYKYNKNKSFLLHGLTEAEDLTLMCDYGGFVFNRDLEWCPSFNNLRVLVMNDWWFVPDDFYGLDYILKHSPVLEKLTLVLLSEPSERDKNKVEILGRYTQMERPATISKHLKEVKVNCEVVDEEVHKVLKFLGIFGIYFLFK